MHSSQSEDHQFIIYAQSTAVSAPCPRCEEIAVHTHGWHQRKPQDLPVVDQNVRLQLAVRRFLCSNVNCSQRTFVERFPDWLPFYARRTERLSTVLREIGFQLSAESARRLLRFMRISTSGDTVLRIVKRTSLNYEVSPRVVGLDDWAIRKGFNYGSIIIDQETRRVIELVKGRFAEDIQPWFEAHPEVEIVTRDRSADYRKGLTASAP